jgi:hypothetical protein
MISHVEHNEATCRNIHVSGDRSIVFLPVGEHDKPRDETINLKKCVKLHGSLCLSKPCPVKLRVILRVNRIVFLRVGADAAIPIDGHSFLLIPEGITSKKYIHCMQKVASSLQSYTNKRGGTDATIEAFA